MAIIGSFGNGLEDGGWNAWVGAMTNADQVLGILHGAYGLGATISPLIATTMITKAGLPWWDFYYILVSCDYVFVSCAIMIEETC